MSSACLQWPDKDPEEVLDYDVDWSLRMAAGELLDTVTWTISPTTTPPLTKDSQSHDDPLQTATIWLSGGLDGTDYQVNCNVVADSGRAYDRRIGLNVRQQQ
jgi:hypothetical protein